MTLRERLAALIRLEGPLAADRFMEICLHDPDDGYYATRPDLGETGDFITAPLVSQMFGELLGLWAAEVWARLGRPPCVRLVELGPGHGVMMVDMLRAASLAEDFLPACDLWLVETSAPLRRRQAAALDGLGNPRWAARLESVPGGAPVILLANEFLDCLPIRQAMLTPSGWRERRIGVAADGSLTFVLAEAVDPPAHWAGAAEGCLMERSAALIQCGRAIGERVAASGGAGLFIDYGRDAPGPGDTLQALRGHAKVAPLEHPGEADLTAHVDFPAFLAAARSAGARTGPIVGQGDFLAALGVHARAAALALARPDRAPTIARQLERLVAHERMGGLFKVAVVHAEGLEVPGFESAS